MEMLSLHLHCFGIAFCFICLYFSAFITHTVSTMSHLPLAKTAKYSLSFEFFCFFFLFFLLFFSPFGKRSHFCQHQLLEWVIFVQGGAVSAVSKHIPSCSPSVPGWALCGPWDVLQVSSCVPSTEPSPCCLCWGSVLVYFSLVFFFPFYFFF